MSRKVHSLTAAARDVRGAVRWALAIARRAELELYCTMLGAFHIRFH